MCSSSQQEDLHERIRKLEVFKRAINSALERLFPTLLTEIQKKEEEILEESATEGNDFSPLCSSSLDSLKEIYSQESGGYAKLS